MRSRIATLAAACTCAMIMTAGPALAQSGNSPGPTPGPVTEITSGLVSPLKVAFGPDGSFLVAESFAGLLSSISATGEKSVLVNAPGQEIAGVSYQDGTTYYFNNDQGAGPEPGGVLLPARLMKITSAGVTTQITDLSEFEATDNPDGDTIYGVRDASDECLDLAPYMQSPGELFSHPYSSVPGDDGVYVGDAGANAILHVTDDGDVTLVKALRAEPIEIDAAVIALAAQMGMIVPDCMLGLTYYAQPVPTDVTVKGQWLYYTVLPGVPGEGLGVGKVYRVHLQSGVTQLLAENLAAPTGIAVSRDNTVYVAQLFGDGVSTVKNGCTVNVLPAMMASDVQVKGNTLVALTNALAATGGSLVTMRLR
ncbi:ScyD/ScyE family protein [Arthrobacter sp. TWP1-1]|uniref:ScyD/ScyE family protein n=1 Tax=Arthrobacter sp. TWP1-1 TaxID=2804568 RepID=UPI003CF66249